MIRGELVNNFSGEGICDMDLAVDEHACGGVGIRNGKEPDATEGDVFRVPVVGVTFAFDGVVHAP